MKRILVIILIVSLSLVASTDENAQAKKRVEKQLKIEMEKEKKYAKEQAFYQAGDYDFKGSLVNPDTVRRTPIIKEDELDMDSVYD